MSSGSLVVPCARRTDRQQTGMTWLTVYFAIVLRKHLKKEHLMWRSFLSICDTVPVSKHVGESLEDSILETFIK